MKRVFIVISSLLLNCCTSLTNTEKQESQVIDSTSITIKLDLPDIDDVTDVMENRIDIEPYMEEYKFVKLETTDRSLIGSIDKLEVFEDRIYIMDMQTSSVFVFDMEGNFIFAINDVGQGPAEYIQIDYFDIDKHKKQIVITDLMGYWIYRYNLEGIFLYRQKVPFWCEGVVPLKDGGYGLYCNFRNNRKTLQKEYNLCFLDSTMTVQKTYFPYNSEIYDNMHVRHRGYGVFYYYKDSCRFYSKFIHKLLNIDSDSVTTIYDFDFGKYSFNYNMMFNKDDIEEYLQKRYYYELDFVVENDDYIIFNLSTPTYPIVITGIYCKTTHHLIWGSLFIGKDFDFGWLLEGYDSWIIAKFEANIVFNWRDNLYTLDSRWRKAKKEISEQIAEDDNPVLFFYKLKIF
jgi:hypothetical protein